MQGQPPPLYGQPQPLPYVGHGYPYGAPALKHSGLGLTSFILSILCGLVMFILVMNAGVLEAKSPNGMDEESPEAIVLGLLMMGDVALILMAFVRGLVAIFQKDRKQLFSILGMTFAGLTVLAFVGLLIVGLTVG